MNFFSKEEYQAFKFLRPALPSLNHIARAHPEESTLSLGGHRDVVEGILTYGCNELFYSNQKESAGVIAQRAVKTFLIFQKKIRKRMDRRC